MIVGPTSPPCGKSATRRHSISGSRDTAVAHDVRSRPGDTPICGDTPCRGALRDARLTRVKRSSTRAGEPRPRCDPACRASRRLGRTARHARCRAAHRGGCARLASSVQDVRNLADLVRRAADARPDHPALRWHDRVITWAELDAQVDAVAAGLAGARPARASDGRARPGRDRAAERAGVRGRLLRRAAGRPVAVPVNPGYTARELRHLLDDSGAAVLVGTPATCVGRGRRRTRRAHTFTARASCRAAAGRVPAEPARRRRGPGRAALHLRHRRRAEGRDAHPPGADRQPRPARRARRRRRSARTTSCCSRCRCSTRTGSTPASARSPTTARRGVLVDRFDPADTLDLIARHGVTVRGRRAADVRRLVADGRPARGRVQDRAARGLRRRAAGPGDRAPVQRGVRAAGHRGVRADRDRAGASPRRWPARRKPGSIGRPIPGVEVKLVAADGAEIAGRTACSTRTTSTTTRPARPAPTRARSSCAARTCSPATGRTAATGRTPTAGGPPATWPTPTPTATCSWSTGSAS